jgi:hypothetical protein
MFQAAIMIVAWCPSPAEGGERVRECRAKPRRDARVRAGVWRMIDAIQFQPMQRI